MKPTSVPKLISHNDSLQKHATIYNKKHYEKIKKLQSERPALRYKDLIMFLKRVAFIPIIVSSLVICQPTTVQQSKKCAEHQNQPALDPFSFNESLSHYGVSINGFADDAATPSESFTACHEQLLTCPLTFAHISTLVLNSPTVNPVDTKSEFRTLALQLSNMAIAYPLRECEKVECLLARKHHTGLRKAIEKRIIKESSKHLVQHNQTFAHVLFIGSGELLSELNVMIRTLKKVNKQRSTPPNLYISLVDPIYKPFISEAQKNFPNGLSFAQCGDFDTNISDDSIYEENVKKALIFKKFGSIIKNAHPAIQLELRLYESVTKYIDDITATKNSYMLPDIGIAIDVPMDNPFITEIPFKKDRYFAHAVVLKEPAGDKAHKVMFSDSTGPSIILK